MANPDRHDYPGAWHHIRHYALNGRTIFIGYEYYQLFLNLLNDISSVFGVEIHSYCLLGSEYHLLIRSRSGNVGDALRHLNSVFTQRHNARTGEEGPLFKGRYKSTLVDPEWVSAIHQYIHQLPTLKKAISNFLNYPWSSVGYFANPAKAPAWLHTSMILDVYPSKESYMRFMSLPLPAAIWAFYGKKRVGSIIGSESFLAKSEFERRSEAIDTPTSTPSIDMILSWVEKKFEVPRSQIMKTTRGRGKQNTPRLVAMYLCRYVGRFSLKEIAKEFGVDHDSTVSVGITRLMKRLEANPELKAQLLPTAAETN